MRLCTACNTLPSGMLARVSNEVTAEGRGRITHGMVTRCLTMGYAVVACPALRACGWSQTASAC